MSDRATRHRFEVDATLNGARLDQAVAAGVDELSRRKARVVIDLGGVYVDGKRVKVASRTVRAGQRVEVVLGNAFARATKKVGRAARNRDAAELPAYQILHCDDEVVVVDKPAGLLTAPTPEGDRGNLAALLQNELGGELFVVHRLDLPTSGPLVFARTEEANRRLSELFRVHDVDRSYLAVVEGRWEPESISVDSPVAGRDARTHFEVVERFESRATLLRAILDTGRTHQIRLHTSERGHPVAGDRRYRARSLKPPRLALHAIHLGFRHPASGDSMSFDVPLPPALAEWLESLRN